MVLRRALLLVITRLDLAILAEPDKLNRCPQDAGQARA